MVTYCPNRGLPRSISVRSASFFSHQSKYNDVGVDSYILDIDNFKENTVQPKKDRIFRTT